MSELLCIECGSTEFVSKVAPPGSLYPWLVTHQCTGGGCETMMYSCNGTCNGKLGVSRPLVKYNVYFENRRQFRRHGSQCHQATATGRLTLKQTGGMDAIETEPAHNNMDADDCDFDSCMDDSCDVPQPPQLDDHIGNDLCLLNYCSQLDGDEVVEENVVDLQYGKVWPTFKEPENTSQQFERHIVEDNAFLAASALVSRALFQSPDAIDAVLPPPNIMLFLYIAKLMMSLGLHQQYNLSKILCILYPYAAKNTAKELQKSNQVNFHCQTCSCC